jgi:acyl-CoA dehydrogenase
MTVHTDAGALLADAVQAAAREAELRDGDAAFDRRLWDDLTAIGVPALSLSEELGGQGGTLADAVAAVQAAHRYPVGVPIADVAIVSTAMQRLLRLDATDGITIVAASASATIDGGRMIRGTIDCVPWARNADRLIVLATADDGTAGYAEVTHADVTVVDGHNLADEPRDTITLAGVAATVNESARRAIDEVRSWGALARSAQICGALAAVLELTVLHATSREQFGQPLSGFQAVQHHLAAMAGEVVSAKASVDLAVQLIGHDPAMLETAVAVAKTRTGTAAGECARLAHQVHGAIGFTREHDLQRYTRRLWSWRDEFGTERDWSERLGRLVPGDRLWQTMTSVP